MNRMDADQEDEEAGFSAEDSKMDFLSRLSSAFIPFICGFGRFFPYETEVSDGRRPTLQFRSRLSVGRFDVEHQGNVHGGEFAHRGAIAEATGGVHPVELASQRDDVLARGDVLAPHDS